MSMPNPRTTGPAMADIADLDPTSSAFYLRPDYHEVLASVRAEDPVHRVGDGLVMVTRHADIREVSRDPSRFCSGGGALVNDPIRTGQDRGAAPSVLFLDPPEHARHRGLVIRKFTPRAVSEMRDRIRAIAREVFDRVGDPSGPIDVVAELTAPFPMLVIADLLGIPDAGRDDFRRWSDATIEAPDRPPNETLSSMAELHAFLTALIEDKQREPDEALVSLIAHAEIDGRRLSPDEMFIWLLTLLVAGNETTRSLLSGGMVALAEHPDQRSALVAAPDGIATAVEESLRWVTPIQTFCRTVVADTTVGGVPVARGDYLIMLYASGNRDEEAFGPTAGSFDVTRPVNPAHLAFGFGEHNCLGAALARLESAVFFEELLLRFPDYQVAGSPERVPSTLVAGIRSLPVVLSS
jgi:cytochrome P450